MLLLKKWNRWQESIQNKKVDIGGEKGAQKECCRQKDCNATIIQNYDYEVQTSNTSYTSYVFFLFPWYLLYYVTDLIKKLDYVNCFILFLIRIKFRHAQISVPKIGIPMSKTACINPWMITAIEAKVKRYQGWVDKTNYLKIIEGSFIGN